jgi:hypothetical protein
MSEEPLTPAPIPEADTAEDRQPPAPSLITEQEVHFATSVVSVPVTTTPPPRWRWSAMMARVRFGRRRSTTEPKSRRRSYVPPRARYLDDSQMAREMRRL